MRRGQIVALMCGVFWVAGCGDDTSGGAGGSAGTSGAGGSGAGAGSSAGGSSAGSSASGGTSTGGSAVGGSAAGGSTAGGSSAGGSSAGGSAVGGSSAGGSAGTAGAGGVGGGRSAYCPAEDPWRSQAVLASSFGYDAVDATDALVAAIKSSDPVVLIDKQAGPWNLRPTVFWDLHDKVILLEEGTVLQAISGAFDAPGANLLRFNRARNVKLFGYGATLRMNRSEYLSLPGEWRHSVGVYGGKDITLCGFRVEESGGDAMYLAGFGDDIYTEDVVIGDVTVDGSTRQGISIISAQGVRIDQVEISDVAGKLPEAGIDIEPDQPIDRIVDVVISNSYLHDNHHAGLEFALGRLRGSSEPVSIRVERTRLKHNHHASNQYVATEIQMGSHETDPVKGEIIIEDCEVTDSEWGVLQARRSAEGYRIIIRNLVAKNIVQTSGSPFYIETTSYTDPNTMGGIHFEDVFVEYAGDTNPVWLQGWNTVTDLKDLTGVITRVTSSGEPAGIDEVGLSGATRTNVTLQVQSATAFP